MEHGRQADYLVRMGIETILIVVGLIIVIAISVVTMKTKK